MLNQSHAREQGAGNYTQEPLTNQQWIQIVAIYDPGDALDTLAGVSIFKNGALVSGPADNPAARYSDPDYLIYPMNGSAPFRIGSANLGTFFNGWIDEVAVFDRKLSSAEVQGTLYGSQ